jgi:hypothetical protein
MSEVAFQDADTAYGSAWSRAQVTMAVMHWNSPVEFDGGVVEISGLSPIRQHPELAVLRS